MPNKTLVYCLAQTVEIIQYKAWAEINYPENKRSDYG